MLLNQCHGFQALLLISENYGVHLQKVEIKILKIYGNLFSWFPRIPSEGHITVLFTEIYYKKVLGWFNEP